MSGLWSNVSLPFSVYETVFSLLSLCFADMEVQKMKKAMESLMAANEEKVDLSHKFPIAFENHKGTWHSMLLMMIV